MYIIYYVNYILYVCYTILYMYFISSYKHNLYIYIAIGVFVCVACYVNV